MISAVILTKNEEDNIEACIKTVSWCDEVVVVDDNSTDRTVKRAEKCGARVIPHLLNNDFGEARNFALSIAKGDWVLFIDADERMSESLTYELTSILHSKETDFINAFSMRRIDTMWGKQLLHGETGSIRLVRLARKTSGNWVGSVHERWQVKGNVARLKNPLQHFPHQSINAFLQEINYYTTLRAQELFAKKKKTNVWEIILYPTGKFFVNYVGKMGFLDGNAGIVVALLMSFHSFLVRGKLWLLWQKKP